MTHRLAFAVPLGARVAAVGLALAGAAVAQSAAPRHFPHESPPGSEALPFSDAVLTGDTLYLGGHIGIDPHTGNAAADPATEARLVMDAVRHTLARAGLGMDDLVSVIVYCTDIALYDLFNGVYRGYFSGPPPARAFIGVSRLVRGARFEVSGVARRPAPAATAGSVPR